MHRSQLLQLLENYQPFHSSDTEALTRTLAFVKEHPNCFERDYYEPGHITGSCWIVDAKGESVLLTHHRKLSIWIQPGGHTDGLSDVYESALREGYEETGLTKIEPNSSEIFDIDIHRFPERKGNPAHLHFDIRFAFRAIGNEAYTVSEESHDLRWVKICEMGKWNSDLSMTRMADRWMAQHARR